MLSPASASSLVAPRPGVLLADSRPSFLLSHVAWPLLAYALAFTVLSLLHGDFWWADRLYAWGGHTWALNGNVVTESILHVGGRSASAVAWVLVLCLGVVSLLHPRGRAWRRPLLFLLLSTAATTLIVGALKRSTGMDCPWDLLRYGGDRPFVGLFQVRPLSLPRAACFPAGHASAGFGWIALYFFARATRPAWRGYALAVGIVLGGLFGFAQQLRGAHFLSHDLTTLAIAWFVSLLLYRLMRLPALESRAAATTVTRERLALVEATP